MTCDNVLQHVAPTKFLGDGLCDLETASYSWLQAAGFEPFHIVFMALLLAIVILLLIQTTFKGHDISITTIAKLAAVIAGLIILGIL